MQLSEWLSYIQTLHTKEIDLGLGRVRQVAEALQLKNPACPVITVGGTNGKGSTVAGLEAIYLAGNYRVGAFTSPILWRHNEYARIQGIHPNDEQFCRAFEKVEKARGNIPLTFFEFNTLAVFEIFREAKLDVWILEVGLGGRLDAVNVLDADVAVITSIALDHMQWLGDTREKIAREKAGIFRKNHPAVCGDTDPPITLVEYAKENNVPIYFQQKDFSYHVTNQSWNWLGAATHYENLPLPKLSLQNISSVLMVIELLQKKLPITYEAIHVGLSRVQLPGRLQIIPGEITQLLDVSHNPAACRMLANELKKIKFLGKVRAVFSMLQDKDILNSLREMKSVIDEWYIAPLDVSRGASLSDLEKNFRAAEIKNFYSFPSIEQAYQAAFAKSEKAKDYVVVFGSFSTVAKAGKIIKASTS